MDISWADFSKEMIQVARQRKVPIAGHFELTPRCNLQCKMCYVCQPVNDRSIMEQELTAEQWIKLAREAREAGMLYLLLTGGEVLVRKDFKQIYEEISKMGFIITIFTNATLITPEIAEWLGNNPPSSVGVTLYGASSKTYGQLCGDEKGFERAFRGVELLLSHGVPVELRTTLVRNNAADFDALYRFAERSKVKLSICSYVFLRRDAGKTSPQFERLSGKEMAENEDFLDRTYYSDGKEMILDNTDVNENTPGQIIHKELESNSAEGGSINPLFTCTAGKCSFWITWDGRMLYCGEVDEPATYPLRAGFKEAWEGLYGHCAEIPACRQCMDCQYVDYCMACPARLKNETGCYDKPAPYLCELAIQRALLKKDKLLFKVEKKEVI